MEPINPLPPEELLVPQPSEIDLMAAKAAQEAAEKEVVAAVERKFHDWRSLRQPFEQTWFINAAFDRGNHYVEFHSQYNRLFTPKVPPHRVRLKVNRFQAKLRARDAKFLKNRPKPIVVPATGDYEDYANAKGTQKFLDYIWRKQKLEKKLRHARGWAKYSGKGFWWFHWDPNQVARVAMETQPGMPPLTADQAVGDVLVEVGTPFEVFVPNLGIPDVGDQPEIIRAKLRKKKDLIARYKGERPEQVERMASSGKYDEVFMYEKQIASLSNNQFGGEAKDKDQDEEILVLEYFQRPCASAPKGKYCVVAGGQLLRELNEMPLGMGNLENPYPVVEFFDTGVPGQFWPPTMAEQLVDLQREYNLLRSKLAENLRLMAFPKLLVAKQHQISRGAWTSEPGEIVEYVGAPNLPPPTPWFPPQVNADIWRAIELIQKEFDDITQIYPVSEGGAGTTKSGFQVNLLQEAADMVHGPDIRSMEMSVEEACVKIRRVVKQYYDQPRLIAALGKSYLPEVFEFSASQIDEMADIVIEVGSALPTLKAARQEAVMMLYRERLLGDPMSPQVQRTALSLLEMGGIEEAYDLSKDDESQARMENKLTTEGLGAKVERPHLWEDHQVHWDMHAAFMKSEEFRQLDPMARMQFMAHAALHLRFIQPAMALQMVMEEGLGGDPNLVGAIQMMLPPPPAPGMGPDASGAPGAPQGPGQAPPAPGQ
jgi:hypothetical protein